MSYHKTKDGDFMSYIYPISKGDVTTYKVYLLYSKKKIYLGSYDCHAKASRALEEANHIMNAPFGHLDFTTSVIDYKKIITLCNFRDHKVYIKNPIYLKDKYFYYYLSKDIILTFDMKDLLFFSTYKICKRGNYLYIQDSISQQSLLNRFGILSHSISGKDYLFKNGNAYDFRRDNIEIINTYKGVTKKVKNQETFYTASIYTDKPILLGYYSSEIEAAIAYNKAIDFLMANSSNCRNYIPNDIPFLTKAEYDAIYDHLKLSPRLKNPKAIRKRALNGNVYRGVSQTKSGYRANIGYNKKQIHLGIYPTEKRAAQAYNFASFYLFGTNGHVNEITPLVHDADAKKIAGHLEKHNLTKKSH